ncbi:hypothetical protein F4680DRAFT_454818 [Xylaria scruposa]|nr:hypothetical protein F4680DRAFT_454818 [Xylaria scruposa]
MPTTRLAAAACSNWLLQRKEGALGCDFGSRSSKQSLAWLQTRKLVLAGRVPAHLPKNHPDRSASNIELTAVAALQNNGSFLIGKRALTVDNNFPLKTLLTYASGITNQEVLKRLPGGSNLLQAVEDGSVSNNMIDGALIEHFTILYESAVKHAHGQGVRIKVVILTYPNYLCAREGSDLFDQYMAKYLSLMRDIWDKYDGNIEFLTASEGQAVAGYVCQKFTDTDNISREARFEKLCRGIDKKAGLNLLVVDAGASTLNCQALSVYFDEKGRFLNSMSNVPRNNITGTQGGSDVVNHTVRDIIKDEFKGTISNANLAELMTDFDEQKKIFDHTVKSEDMILQGRKSKVNISLNQRQVRGAFNHAFRPGVGLLKEELRRMSKIGRDFAVLFCGGSYRHEGLYNEVSEIMLRTQDAELKNNNIKVRFASINEEEHASSAVSTGAAVGMMRLRRPIDVWEGSAIGLQEVSRLSTGRGAWEGCTVAEVLYSADCELLRHVSTNVPKGASEWLEFSLVCDPNWTESAESRSRTQASRYISIAPPRTVFGGPASTYDLGFKIFPADIPKGKIRISLEQFYEDASLWDRPICLELRCVKMDDRGQIKPDPLNTKWTLQLHTDPLSKLLQVKHESIRKSQI